MRVKQNVKKCDSNDIFKYDVKVVQYLLNMQLTRSKHKCLFLILNLLKT